MRLSTITQWQECLREFSARTPYAPAPGIQFPMGEGPAWHGRPPASEAGLRAAEHRLGTPLPPSLRNFLACSDGWTNLDALYGLCPATRLRWTNDPSYDLVDAWSSFEEVVEVIAKCLIVMDPGDGRFGLVDAARTGQDGEWLAYLWRAGAGQEPQPLPSFAALVTTLIDV